MKAILVIDMPKDCGDCPCIHDELWTCQADKQFREGTYYNGRPSWCPLKPLPQKRDTWDEMECEVNDHAVGWNACLEEILGEEK